MMLPETPDERVNDFTNRPQLGEGPLSLLVHKDELALILASLEYHYRQTPYSREKGHVVRAALIRRFKRALDEGAN